MNHLDRPYDDGPDGGGWCAQTGGDWGSYPSNPGGFWSPNQYEEVTPVCDDLAVDMKMYANLDVPTWTCQCFNCQMQVLWGGESIW